MLLHGLILHVFTCISLQSACCWFSFSPTANLLSCYTFHFILGFCFPCGAYSNVLYEMCREGDSFSQQSHLELTEPHQPVQVFFQLREIFVAWLLFLLVFLLFACFSWLDLPCFLSFPSLFLFLCTFSLRLKIFLLLDLPGRRFESQEWPFSPSSCSTMIYFNFERSPVFSFCTLLESPHESLFFLPLVFVFPALLSC